MPAPHVIECPICFASLKLKAAPRPGAKLKCPKCSGVFSPHDDAPPDVDDADDEDDELPVRQPQTKAKSTGKGKKTGKGKRSKPVDWQVPALIGLGAVILIGIAVGLILNREAIGKLFASTPTLGSEYITVPDRTILVSVDLPKIMTDPGLTPQLKAVAQVDATNTALQNMLGITLDDIGIIEMHLRFPLDGMNPAARLQAARLNDGTEMVVMFACQKPVKRPPKPSFITQGFAFYKMGSTKPSGEAMTLGDHFFLAGPQTVVFGKEATLRKLIDDGKAGKKPAATASARTSPGSQAVPSLRLVIDEQPVTTLLKQAVNETASIPLGPLEGEVKALLGQLSTSLKGVELTGAWDLASINLSLLLHTKDAASATALHQQLEAARATASAQLKALAGNPFMALPDAKEMIEKGQAAANQAFTVQDQRVVFTLPGGLIPRTEFNTFLANMIPKFHTVKLSEGTGG